MVRLANCVMALVVASSLAACGDLTGTEGDEGLLRFTLYTTYDVPESDLRDATIVSGHEQHIDIELTQEGRREIEDPEAIRYQWTPAEGVRSVDDPDSGDPPDVDVTVDGSGVYRIDAMLEGEAVDGVDLQFESSDTIEVDVRVREPWTGEFDAQQGMMTTVTEGSQATFLPIPLGADGTRLAGDIETEVSADPEWMVVPGESVGGVYENGYWYISGAIDFYFIEPGMVTFTITDAVSGGQGQYLFEVVPVMMP